MIKNPVHPGTLLQEEVIKALDLSVTEAAHRLGVGRVTLSRVLNGHTGISAQLAIRLEKAGVSTAETWINLQSAYDLNKARKARIDNVQPLQVA